MLRLENITKDYVIGSKMHKDKMRVTNALKGISIEFRDNEFVAILGPSGCGKTTLLNIVGGLDKYTSGDLIINGKSTKKFKDDDWDSYRNHSVGFVFQSYNLIGHQSVLQNVALALTMSGISKEESKARALDALERVGLKYEADKKPNQLSGGQMQRVAIARAIVNDPDILLADEPTGALDSDTSVQVMEIIKEIAKEKLVIMVTHNSELAEEYATRILSLRDGLIVADTNPFGQTEIVPDAADESEFIPLQFREPQLQTDSQEAEKVQADASPSTGEEAEEGNVISADEYDEKEESEGRIRQQLEKRKRKKQEKSSLSYKSAMLLSYNNLISKRARTILTSIAGSIGIIGITLVLALSAGFGSFIKQTEENSLSKYPLKIEESSIDLNSIIDLLMTAGDSGRDSYPNSSNIYVSKVIGDIINQIRSGVFSKENDLAAFRKFLLANFDESNGFVKYDYGTEVILYSNWANSQLPDTSKYKDTYSLLNPFEKASDTLMADLGLEGMMETLEKMLNTAGIGGGSVNFLTNINAWDELVNNQAMLKSQYELIGSKSKWPESKEEIVLVLDEENEIADFMLFAAGLKSPSQLMEAIGNNDNFFDTTFDANYIIDNINYRLLRRCDYIVEVDDGAGGKKWIDLYNYTNSSGKTSALTHDMLDKDNEEIKLLNSLLEDESVGLTLKISGVVRPKKDVSSAAINGVVAYTKELVDWIITSTKENDFIIAQQAEKSKNLLNDVPFINDEAHTKRMKALGFANLDKPDGIYIYANSFEGKERIIKMIDEYNASVNPKKTIKYTDELGILMESITKILTSITYILIGFSAISLIVSSIMIAIITYTSVLERTKEIGILRSLGARKSDIARVFNSETALIGFISGGIGVIVTVILQYPISAILNAQLGIPNLMSLVWWHALIMIVLSVILSLIAGVIPSQIAAKKDPVTALRTE